MKKLIKTLIALFRFNDNIICEMSKGKQNWNDYHDYPDSKIGEPWHFYTHTCKRCGKEFII